MTFEVGSLVRARGREWVVLPESKNDPELLVLRPLGGIDEEVTGIYLPLELYNLGIHVTWSRVTILVVNLVVVLYLVQVLVRGREDPPTTAPPSTTVTAS